MESFRPTSISLVIPAFNEELLLEASVERQRLRLSALGVPFEVIVVDDGSRDRTSAVAETMAARFPEVTVLTLRPNQGVGAAIWAGYELARYEWMFANAVDEPLDLIELPRLFADATRADVIVVSRLDRRANPPLRKVTSLVNYWLIRMLFATAIRDFQFVQIYRRSILAGIRPAARDTFMPPELLLRAISRGARVQQVQAPFHGRTGGTSRYNDPRRYARTLFEMARFWWELRRTRAGAQHRRSSS